MSEVTSGFYTRFISPLSKLDYKGVRLPMLMTVTQQKDFYFPRVEDEAALIHSAFNSVLTFFQATDQICSVNGGREWGRGEKQTQTPPHIQ